MKFVDKKRDQSTDYSTNTPPDQPLYMQQTNPCTCSGPTLYMQRTNPVHTADQPCTCSEPTLYMQQTNPVHAADQPCTCSGPTLYMQRTNPVHAADQPCTCSGPTLYMHVMQRYKINSPCSFLFSSCLFAARAAFLAATLSCKMTRNPRRNRF